MNKRIAVVAAAVLALVGFAAAGAVYKSSSSGQDSAPGAQPAEVLVRPHSPVIGRQDAPVTIVEFFDPSCETCRAFYPVVKRIMAANPREVRLVIRYVPLHVASEETIRILEAARAQGVFVPVMEAMLAAQPEWHDDPEAKAAWTAAAGAGLDVVKARATMDGERVTAVLRQDMADAQRAGVQGTPTFFVNGKPLMEFGAEQLDAMVRIEVAAAR